MNIDFQEILKELEFRVPKGIINLNEESQVTTLVQILRENGVSDANEYAQRARVVFSYVNEASKTAKPKKKPAAKPTKKVGTKFKAFSKEGEKAVYFKTKEKMDAAIKSGSHISVDQKKKNDSDREKQKTTGKSKKEEPKTLGGSGLKSDAEKRKDIKQSKPSKVDERLDAEKAEKIAKTYNTDKTFTESGMTHDDRKKLLKKKNVSTIKGVDVSEDDVYNAMGIKKGECKFPAKYMSVIALALTHSKGKYTITDLTDSAGAGTLDSTLGELMILMASTISDSESRKKFFGFLRENIEKGGKQSPITKEWVDAAENSCEAFDRKLKRNCGGGANVQGNFWDIEKEAAGAGVKNYKRDKGKSTDINSLINCTSKDGKTTQIWQQPSLKKSKDVNALNKTTNSIYAATLARYGSKEEKALYNELGNEFDSYNGLDAKASAGNYTVPLKDGGKRPMTIAERKTEINKKMAELEQKYSSNIPDAANPKKASERQRKLHESLANDKVANTEMNKFFTNWQSMNKDDRAAMCKEISRKNLSQKGDAYESELNKMFDTLSEYEIDTPEKFQDVVDNVLQLSGKEKSKFMVASMYAVNNANKGKETACGEYKKKLTKNSHGHSEAVLKHLIKDDENKKALLEIVSKTFPLKELMEGKEWAILGEKGGGINLDNHTISQCLGAKNFEDVVEKLQIVDFGDKKEPTLVYSADNGKRNIPISKINCRPDGIMYGTTWKLEMDIHDKFADCCKSHDA